MFILFFSFTGCSFTPWQTSVEKDYTDSKWVFDGIITEYRERDSYYVDEENCELSEELKRAFFSEMKYQSFNRIDEHTFFFCKGSDGMDKVGLLYAPLYWTPDPKEHDYKTLDTEGFWHIYSYHML